MIVIGLKGLSIMANEYESIILDDEKFQELMTKYRNAASDVAKILLSSDSDSNGELTENELAVGLLDLILQLANNSTSEADPEEPTYETPSGYSFTGIRKGSQKLDLTRITNKLKDLEARKSNIGHTHPASSIATGVFDDERLPGVEANGGLSTPIKSTSVSTYSDKPDISASGIVGASGTTWNGITSDMSIGFSAVDKSNDKMSEVRTVVKSDGSVINRLYSRNCLNGTYQENYIGAGVSKSASGMSDFYEVKNVDKFYQGIKPLPRHSGIYSGLHEFTTTESTSIQQTISFSFPDSGPRFSSRPNVILTPEFSTNDEIRVNLKSASTSSFVVNVSNPGKKSGLVVKINWIAIGPYTY